MGKFILRKQEENVYFKMNFLKLCGLTLLPLLKKNSAVEYSTEVDRHFYCVSRGSPRERNVINKYTPGRDTFVFDYFSVTHKNSKKHIPLHFLHLTQNTIIIIIIFAAVACVAAAQRVPRA